MTLMGNTADVYAPGEAGTQGLGTPGFQNVNRLGRWDLSGLQQPNVILAIAGLAVVAWLLHKGTHR